ncbi:MAG: MBL fold metallo-hydrolase [Chloroflexota bacterium]
MRIHFHGAAQTVTGSQFLLEVNGARLLLECGLFQGRRKEAYERNLSFPFDPLKLDAVLLSHAHIDHSGNLPNLVKQGYSKPIYTTPATASLAEIMLLDSGHIQEADVAYINKKRSRKHEALIEPIYTQKDAAEVAQFMQPIPYEQAFEPTCGVTAQFFDAGHILGSAGIRLEIREAGRMKTLWFSSDVGRRHLPILRDPVMPFDADTLLMECTYGDKTHRDPEAAHRELEQVILRTVARQGKIIIPAFAVGRTQELVYSLHMMIAAGSIPPLPVYVDSPLAVNASRVFEQHPECYDDQTRYFIQLDRHPALRFPTLSYVQSVDESKRLNDLKGPLVIISASGMAEAGRILHHLKNNIEDKRNTILIVSWQAPHTLGRRLAERAPVVKIFGEEYQRRAEIATIGGLSAHAGQDMLLEYAQAGNRHKRNIFLVHGEPKAASALQERLAAHGFKKVFYPEAHAIIEI